MSTQGKADGQPRIRVAETADGMMTYLVSEAPEALPPVQARDLERAWDQARTAAIAAVDGPPLLFRFRSGADEACDLALTDTDARCWARAVDAASGLDTLAGLSVCLRLLALVELMGRVPWAAGRVALKADGAEIDADLLRAAAAQPLNREARFDAQQLQARLSRLSLTQDRMVASPASRRPGASA